MSSESDSETLFPKFSTVVKDSEKRFWSKFTLNNDEDKKDVLNESHDSQSEIKNDDSKQNQNEIIPDENNTKISNEDSSENPIERITGLLDDMKRKVIDVLNQPIRRRGRKRKRIPYKKPNKKNKDTKTNESVLILSDDETDTVLNQNLNKIDLNPDVYIKVLWRSVETHTFKLKKYQKLTSIKNYYVENKQANPELLFFTLNNKEFDLDRNSWVSLRLNGDEIIEGSLLPESYLIEYKRVYFEEKCDYKFKVQMTGHRSKSIEVKCKKDDRVEMIFWQVILETEKEFEEVKLSFDGVILKPDQELSELDIMDGDCFDLL